MTTEINYNNNPRRNLRLYWKQFYPSWDIPTGYHVHHIKPKCTFADPSDPKIHHPSNLIALYPDDHYTIHKCRGDTYITKKFVTSITGQKLSLKTKQRMRKPKSKEHCENIRKARLGTTLKQETKDKISIAHEGMKLSAETKRKISEEVKSRTKAECPYCLRSFDPGNYKQHHGDKCKMAGVSE